MITRPVAKRLLGKFRRLWKRERDQATMVATKREPAASLVDPAFFAEMQEHIAYLTDRIGWFRQQLQQDRGALDWWTCLPPESYLDKDVLDLGCGTGAGCAAFLERGARFVWGIDPTLTPETLGCLSRLPRSRFDAAELSAELFGDQHFDLIFAQLVTEHLRYFPNVMDTIYDLLKPGGRFVAQHDNYYSPMGGHDHAFMGPDPADPARIRFKGSRCWKSPLKCAASEDFRRQINQRYDWMFKDWTTNPDDCTKCAYYHRAHLWGHLLFQDSYATDFPGDFFRASRSCGLNKITPFQLRQFLIEAGFTVTHWAQVKIENTPPPELAARFPIEDLQTSAILLAADKPSRARYSLSIDKAG
jgi:SAM-dependent methyltransferase